MPFDGTKNEAKINRAILVDALRHDTEWEWNFCHSAGCAIGMGRAIFGNTEPLHDILGLTDVEYYDIFGFISSSDNIIRTLPTQWCDFYGMPRTEVTPSMVADKLEAVS